MQVIALPFDNKFDSIAHLDDLFQPRDSVPGGASEGNVLGQSFHVQVVGVRLKLLVRDSLGLTAAQRFRWTETKAVQEAECVLQLL